MCLADHSFSTSCFYIYCYGHSRECNLSIYISNLKKWEIKVIIEYTCPGFNCSVGNCVPSSFQFYFKQSGLYFNILIQQCNEQGNQGQGQVLSVLLSQVEGG